MVVLPNRVRRTLRRKPQLRRGAVLILTALMLVFMLGLLAFSIDVGYMLTCRTEAQRAADAGALAGAGSLADGVQVAEQQARDFTQRNAIGRKNLTNAGINVEFGLWNRQGRTFTQSLQAPDAVKVTARRTGASLFFGGIFGRKQFDIGADAIASYGPRDIMVVLDYSASMNDDSELGHLNMLGRSQIEANLQQIYGQLGSPRFGNMSWNGQSISTTNNTTIKSQLGLSNVRYPYPSGSWDDYIDYVKSSSVLSAAGYNKRFSYLTLVNYLLEQQPKSNETPDLWQTSEQPITALKDGFSVFLSYLGEAKTGDRVGLTVYTAADGTAVLESPLTADYQKIENISRRRQAGHYDEYTNIGAGLRTARLEMEKTARSGALKLIVLMTDGIANRPSNTTVAKQFVLDEARLAARDKFPVVTISLGAAADKALMQSVADMTGGVHFNVPGGRSVSDYERQLKEVFRQIADDRPLKLVK